MEWDTRITVALWWSWYSRMLLRMDSTPSGSRPAVGSTRVFHRLRAMGVDIDSSVYTLEQAKAAILEKLRGGAV